MKYNDDGLLEWGVDARGAKTAFAYDGLNRVSSVTYTGETGYTTPNVTYTYDQARSGSFNLGALTRVETAAVGDTPATATEFDYDQMGRVKKHRQWIAGQQYDLEYGYNLAGQLTSEKYPSGRVVTNSYDANGRLAGIADQNRTYLSNVQYQQFGGALSAMIFGNGIQQTLDLNDRGQLRQMAWVKDGNVVQRYDYAFGQINPATNTVDPTKNNGQLAQVESYNAGTAANPIKQFTQKFVYDSIGRLERETEYRGDNSNQVYSQKFSYDRFGNRYLKAAENPANQNPLFPTFIEDNNIDRATNRLTSNTNTTYDEAGQVVSDGKFRSMDFVYDANGRTSIALKINVPDALSVFDAGGNKVATKVNGVWRFLIYDVGGKLVAEYGGLNAADEGGVKYIHQDIQGSTRCVTSNSGAVLSRIDYQAFGEELPSNIGQRTVTGYQTADSIRNRYALTARDEGTGLDDTWFRKLENRAGRWTSPDPYNGSMSVGDPQSFNRYSYVNNQPTNFIDPAGLNPSSPGTTYGAGILWTLLYGNNVDGWKIIRQWFEPYPSSGGSEETGQGSGASLPAPSDDTDCDKFVDYLSSTTEKMKNEIAARVQIGSEFGQTGKALLDASIKFEVSGFRTSLAGGGQQSDVLRHVVVSAASYLLDGMGLAAGVDNARQSLGDWWDGGARTAERDASRAGNSAGLNVGVLAAARIRNTITASNFANKLKKILCG